jgi:carbonic anhydrase
MDATMDGRKRLVDGNAMFRKSIDSGFLARLSKNQEPFVAILSCSDSRVSPVKIFNLSLGEAFVVRVAGNSASDQSVLGSLEYAVDHLHVKYLLVLGHTSCGAVRAMVEGEFLPNLRTVMKDLERARFKAPTDQTNDQNLIAENNVRLQLRAIQDNSTTISRAVSEDKLTLLGAMYDLATGTVRFI